MRLTVQRLVAAAAVVAFGIVSMPATQAADSRTIVTVLVDGCEGCRVGASTQLDDGDFEIGPYEFAGTGAVVKGGSAALSVPTRATRGMHFTITSKPDPTDQYGGLGAAPIVVLGDTSPAGSTVTPAQAKGTRKISACWAGTRAQTATLRIHVSRYVVPTAEGQYGVQLRAWASPTARTIGPYEALKGGKLGSQDGFECPPA